MKRASEFFHLNWLNIGLRLTLCFVLIILAMLIGNAVLLWQFRQARAQTEILTGVDQKLLAVMEAHVSLMSFHARLKALTDSENAGLLAREAEDLRRALFEDRRRTTSALGRLPPEVKSDPTLLTSLAAIQDALPAQLDAITVLAKSGDWDAVRLRLANQVRPLESRSSTLVADIDREVSAERAQAVSNIERAQRRILLIVPVTALLTLLFAGVLGLVITRSITRPLRRLMDAAKALGQGDFQHRVSITGTDELADLGRVVNDTAGMLRDHINANRQAEEALRQTQATLAHVTRVTTLGEITASIAHEVNQPLAGAITNANTCLRWLQRDPPGVVEAREAASRSATDATRAAEIIKRIRNLFRKGTLQREPVAVNEVIREIIVVLGDEADRHSVSIHTDLADDLPPVMADRVQLQQVIMNLVLNGLEAMKGAIGPGELAIESHQTDDGHVLISVSDSGVGLSPQHTNQMFDAFFTTKPEGTGMGLPISRSIIESHGGRLWATPNSGRGATFHFSLPVEVEVAT